MIKTRKLLALLLVLCMCVGLLAACGDKAASSAEVSAVEEASDTPLVVGYSPFNSKFSPFFSETAYDQDAWLMTQLPLFTSDRTGAVIQKGIEGETVNYNGTDYTYYGPADMTITENDDGTVFYDIKLRDDLKFSDGEPMTIDDVIFSMYVLCDPTYDGSSTLFAQPIEGMEEYRTGMDTMYNLLLAAGRDNKDFKYWDEATQTEFWASLDKAGEAFAQEIVDYCKDNGYNAPEDSVAACAANWGFELPEDATAADFFATMVEAYEGDYATLSDTESAGSSLSGLMEDYDKYTIGVETGKSAPNISGIQKVDDYNMRVVMTQVDATAIYQLTFAVAPLHYYGDKAQYDYNNNSFGFPKGDLSMVRSKTTQQTGAGPYKFIKFENGVINYEANENYFKGAPKTKYLNFQQCTTDDDKLNGVVTGTVDITDPSLDEDTVKAIETANGGALSGDKITTNTVDNLGYGYIGMNANVMNVGGEPASDASKALRKAFATILCVYRDVAIDSYYGERASVINYPISNTSWAAPQPADDGYRVAFSMDKDGKDIYTSGMSDQERYDAALQAALGFFEEAGFTVKDGKLTEAPEGASLEYTAWIPADGTGDHPAFMIFSEASNALKTIGMNLIIKDLTNSSELWDALDAQQVAMWAAAWGATVDPDMYQIYFSGDDTHDAGGSNYQYAINDAELNQLILDARASTDQAYRKSMYKACLDIIIDWAVEVPTYQRQNAIIFSSERVNLDSVTPDITTFYPWYSEIENIVLK